MAYAFDLGERKIIELIAKFIAKMPDMPLPLGDDVSTLRMEDGKVIVLKGDMLVGRTDVPPGMTLEQAARKAVVMNVSDFSAKGVRPIALLASLAFPSYLKSRDIEQIAMGLNSGAREYGAYVIGGDVNESSVDLVISCFLFGVGEERKIIGRKGAKPGDVLAVTGAFGNTSAGLKILLEGAKAPKRLKKKILRAVYMPRARLKEGLALAETGAITSSIDSSDGLAVSLHELGKMSEVGFLVTKVPISMEARQFAEENDLRADELAFYGGEEYELVATVDPSKWNSAEEAVRKVGGRLIPIGHATESREILLEVRGKRVPIEPRGFEHFKR